MKVGLKVGLRVQVGFRLGSWLGLGWGAESHNKKWDVTYHTQKRSTGSLELDLDLVRSLNSNLRLCL